MAAFRDMEEVSQGLLSLLGANRAEAQQRRLLGRHEQVVERLLETQDLAEQRLREILATEEEVAQCLLDAKAQAHQRGVELQQLKAELQKAGEENTHLKASLLQLTTELEELKEVEAGLERQEREVDEDTTVTIPSAVYVAQLYHRVSKIEWDYECEPGMVKGIHHGPSIAQPIHLDSTQLSKKFISDYLWNLVDTDW
ncbi:kinetochore protein Spc24 isoform X3 [Canis lupus familiaris]|uniref:Kinetochore protein Spc24 n=3 Tax=Canis lupus TaxID=9612 RepID=A0A8C0Z0C5_CANLF|nr:kinetochore protein Spc24 [Canis lupus dingo]XP_038284516.1 kinetochore protein Spc24 isoform X3 [Canis lupus familiaris]XP_038423182.1 kinetochore protein Spc24 isoform X3 [Canis lupus familiaris]XP_853911.1 kinetochore protein Spc24 isoform X3 [Canis lupus familiaris]|eukprot:XP_853911.1 kinetochore protein Spc24 isoform X3 [Canis lupus familiaris]